MIYLQHMKLTWRELKQLNHSSWLQPTTLNVVLFIIINNNQEITNVEICNNLSGIETPIIITTISSNRNWNVSFVKDSVIHQRTIQNYNLSQPIIQASQQTQKKNGSLILVPHIISPLISQTYLSLTLVLLPLTISLINFS
jgi:hypothetical protein